MVIESVADPNVPPRPPRITLKNARAFALILLSGDPDEASVITRTVKELVSDTLPR